jgi:rhamnogalacturonyl hydrolase YesR
LCFSYTPVDKEHVHNANLFVAEFLFRIGKEIDNKEYIIYGIKALNYTLNEQNCDGSFYYFGLKDKEQYNLSDIVLKRIDHYHTGFVLRSLYSIYTMTKNKDIFERLKNCYNHYCNNLFENKTIPKFTPESKYPINIHSCAEAITCTSVLQEIFPNALEYAQNVFLWTKNNMQTKDGWFIYMIIDIKGIKWKVKFPYIRWGQAWMLRALSQYYFLFHKNKEDKFEKNNS